MKMIIIFNRKLTFTIYPYPAIYYYYLDRLEVERISGVLCDPFYKKKKKKRRGKRKKKDEKKRKTKREKEKLRRTK